MFENIENFENFENFENLENFGSRVPGPGSRPRVPVPGTALWDYRPQQLNHIPFLCHYV